MCHARNSFYKRNLDIDCASKCQCWKYIIQICTSYKRTNGDEVDKNHGLSCVRGAGRFAHHAALNNTLRRSLASINVPALLQPQNILCDDGKCVMAYRSYHRVWPLVWDDMCTIP